VNTITYVEQLWNTIETEYKGKTRLLFSGNRTAKCSLSLTGKFIVIGKWYCEMIRQKSGDELAGMVILHSLGHELTHKKDRYYFKSAFPVNKKYSVISKINEVHADYGGAAMIKLSKKNFVCVMEAKWGDGSGKITSTHPSHKQCIEYAKMGKFDDRLVYKICIDNNYECTEELCKLYKDIELE